MQIILEDKYKSLHPFKSEALERLTIITGRNGSGKSQLLELITKKAKNDELVKAIRFSISPNINGVQAEGIIKETSLTIDHDKWKNVIQKNLNQYNSFSQNFRNLQEYLFKEQLQEKIHSFTPSSQENFSNAQEYLELLNKVHAEQGRVVSVQQQSSKIYEYQILRQLINPNSLKLRELTIEICNYTGKQPHELRDADFYNTPLLEHYIDNDTLFTSQVELIFYNYAKRRDLNRKNWFYKNEEGIQNSSISDNEFVGKFVPPWIMLNEILSSHKIDFQFAGIEKTGFSSDVPVKFEIIKKSTNEIIFFNDLSSGEKVIIGLILKLFTSEYYGENLNFPELLILDEPDAHLHPEMSKLLLDVLEKTFVEKFNISVLITTHSPSTIALANENCIFQLTNGKSTSLKKISKDEALSILTSFIPTLSIEYQNHKQIFVESPTDRYYYQIIFDRLDQVNKFPYKLYFISNGYGKGNSIQVIETTSAIRKANNKTCFGVIDWDKKNKDSDFVKVHGLGKRYSIENYVYDPIYLTVLLLELNAHKIHQDLNLDLSFNEYLIGEKNDLLVQSINYFFDAFYNKFAVPEEQKSYKRKVKYFNQIEIEIPIWYLEFQGHDLEVKLKEVFPALQKYRGEGDLQKKLSLICVKCYPLIPQDTVDLINNIINIG